MMKAILGKQVWQHLRWDWKGERLEANQPGDSVRNLDKATGGLWH